MSIHTVIFDLGGVLIDWNPRHLYRKLFDGDEEGMEHFLANVCTGDWNAQQDGGRPFAEAVALLQSQHPEFHDLIAAFHLRWEEMLGDVHQDVLAMMRQIKASGLPVYALTNWSAETFPIARQRFDFLQEFKDILVSGEENMKKPDAEIYHRFLEKFGVEANGSVFIDDSLPNVKAAKDVGIHGIHFQSAEALRNELQELNLLKQD